MEWDEAVEKFCTYWSGIANKTGMRNKIEAYFTPLYLAQVERAEKAEKEVIQIRKLDNAWSLHSVMETLIEASEHLLRDHDCDIHRHEELQAAIESGQKWLKAELARRVEGE